MASMRLRDRVMLRTSTLLIMYARILLKYAQRMKFAAAHSEDDTQFSLRPVPTDQKSNSAKGLDTSDVSFVIPTFRDRLADFTTPLVTSLVEIFPMSRIVIVLNGEANPSEVDQYRSDFVREMSWFPSVRILDLSRFYGLSHNWNLGIRTTGRFKNIVLNDDLLPFPRSAKGDVRSLIQALDTSPLVLAPNFSSFGITRDCLVAVGWFDERLVGFGGEDADFLTRYVQTYDSPPTVMEAPSIQHVSDTSGQRASAEPRKASKYSNANLELLNMIYPKRSKLNLRETSITRETPCYPHTNAVPLAPWHDSALDLLATEDSHDLHLRLAGLLNANNSS